MKIAIAADHAGFSLKEKLRQKLAVAGHEVLHFRTRSEAAGVFPDFAQPAAPAGAAATGCPGIHRTRAEVDPDVYQAIQHETARQDGQLELIASENFTSEAVLEATGSVFTNKYAEGYPGKRYYGGCEFTDVVENLARDRAKKLFGAEHTNRQPQSGSQAHQAAHSTVRPTAHPILGMNLAHGGHLTHC